MEPDADQPRPAAGWLEFGGETDNQEDAMNTRQIAFFRQAQSDWSVFCHFHGRGSRTRTWMRRVWCGMAGVWPLSFAPCHKLHYLQMCTEKLAKAYYRTDPELGTPRSA